MLENIFENNGLITKSSFGSIQWKKIFEMLEVSQQIFLMKDSAFRTSNYSWPKDALHNWSRIWEYPYTFYQLQKYLDNYSNERKPRVLDFGSGLTFFPFAVNNLGYEVYCSDIDKSLESQYKNACISLNLPSDTVKYVDIIENKLKIEDNYFDIIYSISVLEHILEPHTLIAELFRILKPNGLLILTFDLDMMGNSQIDLSSYEKLKNKLHQYFENYYQNKQAHPIDILYSNEGEYKLELSSKYFIKRRFYSIMKFINKDKYIRKLACEYGVFLRRDK